MEIQDNYIVSEWLNWEQLQTLLRTGELRIPSFKGEVRIYLQFPARSPAKLLLEKA